MHSKLLSWLALIGLFAIFAGEAVAQGVAQAPAGAAASTQQPGRIRASRVVGQVTVEDIATKATQALANDSEISQGSIVRTGENSSVVLLFSNGASINLAFSSDLNIEQFTQDPFAGNYEPAKATEEPSVSTTSINLTRGELVGNVKKLKTSAGSKFTVGTPVGAAGIRGTTFRIVYRPTGNGQAFNFVLTTIEGNVEIQLASGTIASLPVSVTDNKEVVINDIVVNPTTNQITVTSSTGQTTVLNTPPPANDAPVTVVQQVQAAAQQIAQAVATAMFTPPPPLQNQGQGNSTGNNASGNSNSTEGTGSGNSGSGNSGSGNTGSGNSGSGNSGSGSSATGNTGSGNSGSGGSSGSTTNSPRLTSQAGV